MAEPNAAGPDPRGIAIRLATLDDVEDDCPLCRDLAARINAGQAPTVLAFPGGIVELADVPAGLFAQQPE
jgi:hypothetical protein